MAKKIERVNVAGRELTAKEKAVFDIVRGIGKKVKAVDLMSNEDVTKVCSNIASVRSTMARLEKTHGLFKATVVLDGEKATKAYSIADGIVVNADAADAGEDA